ncbi:cellulose synthase [Tianweitania sediminis]|uniref:Cellulose synthase n=1 Tax=Tianweitania sediminis TaxID=1502156 RepID=A0A8J7RPT8_9HYPH|nr:cellulose synthase [Tianweitania sediminis]MBP0440961.1 cellulose synthase [Tianweitania sediminis]
MKTALIATALATSLSTALVLRAMEPAPTAPAPPKRAARAMLDAATTSALPASKFELTQSQSSTPEGTTGSPPAGSGRVLRMAAPQNLERFSAFLGEQKRPSTSATPAPVMLAQADSAATAQNAATTAPDVSQPQVDETALRYFAREGDQRRLEAEIARLRTLYPNWTPPADPLAVPAVSDPQLDAMWQLYAQGRYAELRKAISDRQAADPAWTTPTDLLDRVEVAEARERLVNASDLKQFETVVRTASETPSLLTCSEVDVLWRVAEAFAQTDRPERARDAYKYVLDNCDNAEERVATVEKAIPLLPRTLVDELLATARPGSDEFAAARLSLARKSVADAGEDPSLTVQDDELQAVTAAAEPEAGTASDARLLGWYYLRRDRPQDAQRWFSTAREREDTAEASQGQALALVAQDKPGEAEEVLYKWRDENDEIGRVYMAAVANYLATEPRVAIDPAVLTRMAGETAEVKDAAAAQQFGWYARDLNQHQTAGQWFQTALGWKPDDEASAYGLALTRNILGDHAGVREIQRLWAGRSERIADLGEDRRQRPARPARSSVASPAGETASSSQELQSAPPVTVQTPQAAVERFAGAPAHEASGAAPLPQAYTAALTGPRAASPATASGSAAPRARTPQGRGCATTDLYNQLSGQAALARGWCLMDLNRPLEATDAFERALQTGNAAVQRDAAYGQSLAYLRRNLVDDAAVAAVKAPQPSDRTHQLEVDILTQRATGFFEQERYNEALLALDQRSRLATERTDLMVLRGYAYLNMQRLNDAERVFRAVAAVGNREGLKGLAAVNATRGRP